MWVALHSQLMDWPMILPRSDRLVDNGLFVNLGKNYIYERCVLLEYFHALQYSKGSSINTSFRGEERRRNIECNCRMVGCTMCSV